MLLRELGRGALAGLVANIVVGPVDGLLEHFVSDTQKRREKEVRKDSPHHMAGEVFGERILDRQLTENEKKIAQLGFTVVYGLVWGAAYRAVRTSIPQASNMAGLPFAVGFYLACDGLIAPLLKLSPSVHKIPWQLNTKEFVNHSVWTATAESVNRYFDRQAA